MKHLLAFLKATLLGGVIVELPAPDMSREAKQKHVFLFRQREFE